MPEAQERLRALAALDVEPLWVFHRLGPTVDSPSAFSGRRVAVGAPGSGTGAVARALLREYGIHSGINLRSAEARHELEAGPLDAAFFVTSYRDPSVRRDAAYSRKLPGLHTVRLPEGVLDLRDNIPSQDITLLAPVAMLAARADLHPRAAELLLKVAHQVQGPGLPPPYGSITGADRDSAGPVASPVSIDPVWGSRPGRSR